MTSQAVLLLFEWCSTHTKEEQATLAGYIGSMGEYYCHNGYLDASSIKTIIREVEDILKKK